MTMFWSAEGWREPPVPPPDVAAVIADGVMFAQPRSDTHDGWVTAARRAAAAVSPEEVGDAFLESLSSRRLDLRSALGSYAVARALPEHDFRAARGSRWCAVCELRPKVAVDRQLGREVVEALRALPDRKAVDRALRVIPSNKAERESVVEILTLYPGMATEFLAGAG